MMDTASKRHDEDQAPGDSPVIATSSLDKPPCCLVFSPTDPSLLVVGTYNLRSKDAHTDESLSATSDPDAVRRNGGLILCSVGDREM